MINFFIFICLFFSNAAAFAFDVYDGTLYQGKPNLTPLGIKSMPIVYEGAIFPNATTLDFPDKAIIDKVSRTIRASNQKRVVIDIERWHLHGSRSVISDSVNKYTKFIKALKKSGVSNVSLGYYGNLPLRDFPSSIEMSSSNRYKAWQNNNNNVRGISVAVDAVYPSLYAFNDDVLAWRKYAIAHVSEARRLAPGKPVIAFIWPQFHDASSVQFRNQYVDRNFWRQQLETLYRVADGVVIWGGYKQQWDQSAPWWQETRSFMQAHNIR